MLDYLVFSTSLSTTLILFTWFVQHGIYKLRRLYLLNDIYPQKSLASERVMAKQDILDKVKSLYLHRRVTNLYLEDGYISFEDSGFFPLRNIYYIRFAKPESLYYRGTNRIYTFHRRNLDAIAAFLAEIE